MYKNAKKIIIIFLAFFVLISYNIYLKDTATVDVLSKYGSRGEEVKTIQTKLKRWGYYSGSVDGVYGSATEKAVKAFQTKNKLKVDGISGKETLEAMGIFGSTTTTSSNATNSNSNDLNLLARIINGEARGETYNGQVGVGAVVLNRVKNSGFPNTISGVIYQNGAFDAVKDGQINLEPTDSAKKAAQDALNGFDPTGGAIYYFNPVTATNKWIWSRPMTITIGSHRFCK